MYLYLIPLFLGTALSTLPVTVRSVAFDADQKPTPTEEQAPTESTHPELKGFRSLKKQHLKVHSSKEPIFIVQPFVLNYTLKQEEGGGEYVNITMSKGKDSNDLIINIERSGWPDDSVSGVHFRILVTKKNSGYWEVRAAGERSICWRGTVKYTKKLCP